MRESIKKNKKGLILMTISSLFVCFGQLCWKLYTTNGFLLLILGFILYGIGALIMLRAYRYGSLSVLQPMLSVNYIISIFIGYFILSEKISFNKIAGILLIIIGLFFISTGDEKWKLFI